MDTDCGQFHDEDEKDIEEAVLNSIEKQTMLMIDESNSTGGMISEIDQVEIENAVSEAYQKRVERLSENLGISTDKEDDPDEVFFNIDTSSSVEKHIDNEKQASENESDETIEPFLINTNVSENNNVIEEKKSHDEDEGNDRQDEVHWENRAWNSLNEIGKEENGEHEKENEEPVGNDEKVRTVPIAPPPPIEHQSPSMPSDSIPHKLSLNEILARSKK